MKGSWLQSLASLALGILVGALFLGSREPDASLSGQEQSQEVLATVGATELTRATVEGLQGPNFAQLRRQMHDMISQSLEQAIQARLMDLEADARGIGTDSLIGLEVDARLEDPSEQAIADLYEERGLQSQGSLEDLAPQIQEYLRNQSRGARFATLVAELEEKYGAERYLEPMRMAVASDGFPSKGPENAPVTMVAFSDFQCPYCQLILPTLEQIEETYGDQVRLVFRQFPLTQIHPQAVDAARASLCANEQGRFWEMHDAMFANQRALQVDQLKATARDAGLDGQEFDACMDSNRFVGQVTEDLEAGRALGITGTPMVFINGRSVSGAKPYEEFAEIIQDELRRAGR